MTADLQHLFDRAGRNAPAPTLHPDTVIHHARRSRNRRIWLSATAAAVGSAVVVAVVFTGRDLHQAAPLPPSTTTPSPTSSAMTVASNPLLEGQDLAPWHLGGRATLKEEGVVPVPLSSCLVDPLTLGATPPWATTFRANRSTVNDYVLRFADTAAAHQALLAVRAGYNNCQRPAFDHPIAPPSSFSIGSHPVLAEYFAALRGNHPQVIEDADIYSIRVAREGNVLVIIEGSHIRGDRALSMLAVALIRAIPSYMATHSAALCLPDVAPQLCPRSVDEGQ
jgi:hypothetical protein